MTANNPKTNMQNAVNDELLRCLNIVPIIAKYSTSSILMSIIIIIT